MTGDDYLKGIYARMSEMDKFMGEMRAESIARREALAKLEETVEDLRQEQTKTATTVTGLDSKITRWEGKFGGFVMVFTCLMAFFASFKDQILAFIKG